MLLIGDREANTADDVSRKRDRKKQSYWSKTKFADPTNIDAELQVGVVSCFGCCAVLRGVVLVWMCRER